MKKILIGILMLFALAISVIASPVLYEIGDEVLNEAQTLSLLINSTLPDSGTTNTFTMNQSLGSLIKINETAAQFTWTTGYDDAGVYDVIFTVSDLNSSYDESMTITVNNVNRAPTLNLPSATVVQGFPETINLDSYSDDADNDALTYSVLAEDTAKADCAITTNTLTITAASNYTGSASCKIEVSDSDLTANDTISISVEAQNPSVSIATIDFGKVELNTTTSQKSFSISNNGNIDLNNIAITWDSAYDKYNLDFSDVDSSISAGSMDTNVDVEMYIPADESTGQLTIPVTFTSDELNQTFNLEATVLGRLQIIDLDVKVDDDTDSNLEDKEDGYKIGEKASPQSHVTFYVKVENTFPDSGLDINDVFVTVTIRDIDDDEDMEEESEEFDLDPEDTKKVTLEFDLPLKVDEGDYEVTIDVEGEDDDGNDHKITQILNLEVDKDSHDLIIKKAYLSPETIDCSRDVDLDVNVMNIGSKEEDEVVISVKSTALGIDMTQRDIELSEDIDDDENEFEKTFELSIPSTVKAGTYTIEVRAYYDEDKLEDLERVTLKVNDCKPAVIEPEEEEEEEDVEVIMPEEEEIVVTPPVEEETKKKFSETTEYVLLLVLFNIIVVMVVAALLIALLRK